MPTSAPETDLVQYYALRAHEYEAVYAKPERQVDIAQIQAWLPGAFEGRDGVEPGMAVPEGLATHDQASLASSSRSRRSFLARKTCDLMVFTGNPVISPISAYLRS